MGERPPVLIGERVLWLGSGSGLPKSGKVKWIGRLPEIGPDWAVGLELDESLPYGGIDGTWGNRKLFMCRHKHGLIVPVSSVIPQPKHFKPGEPFGGEPFGRTLRSSGKSGSQELAELAPPKPESKVGKLFRAFSNDDSSHRYKHEDLELPSTHLRNPNLERQLAILGTLRRSNLLESARLEGVKSEACLYSVVLEKEENVFRERRRMIHGREFKRSDDTLDRTSSIHSSRSGGSRRDRTSGIFSFFRWFKKEKSEDSEEESPPSPSSPVLRRANGSITGSVDTLFSTATTRSFAFVQPSHYRPYGAANPPEIRICPGPETNTYRNRIRQRDLLRQKEQNISLREKYRLYASETLPRSVDRINEISGAQHTTSPSGSNNSTIRRQKRPAPPPPVVKSNSTSEKSLPITLANEVNDQDIGRQHRRTLSEPSPTRYVKPCHVKGKRKAPPPPNNSNNTAQSRPSDRTLSLQRKKRRAPPPPLQRSPSDEITEILQRAFEDITGSDRLFSSVLSILANMLNLLSGR
uniref:CAP-Gly domain-containing linker protein 1 n=2 Tax=Lygus hesperus TaxID=30085 RepID=A0A0A9YVE1_LYGHE